MISVAEASERILARIGVLSQESVATANAAGRILASAVVAGIERGLLEPDVEVNFRGGKLSVSWEGKGHPVWITGPAVAVFDGEICL